MIDYSSWPKKFYNPFDLYFDPFNPRFPEDKQDKSQDEILYELCEEYDVLTLVEQIKAIGFIPYEQPIGYFDKNDERLYVIEGNRRLAAVRVLLNPNSAPGKIIDRVRSISKDIGDKKPIEQLEIVLAPSREEAEPAILDKHIQDTKKGWTPLEQAVFSLKFMEKTGLTMAEIQSKYNISKTKFKDAVSIDQLYSTALKVKDWTEDYIDRIKKTGGKQGFSITNLHRYTIVNQRFRNYGLDRDNNGDLFLKIPPNQFAHAFSRLIQDIVDKEADSRNLDNWYKDIFPSVEPNFGIQTEKRALNSIPKEEFWEPLKDEPKSDSAKPHESANDEQQGQSNQGDNTNKTEDPKDKKDNANNDATASTQENADDQSGKGKSNSKKAVKSFIITEDDPINCSKHKKIQLIIDNLRNLDGEKYSIAAALLVRTLIEIATYVFLQNKDEIKPWQQELKKQFAEEAEKKRKALFIKLKDKGVTLKETDLNLNVKELDQKVWPNLSSMLNRVCDKDLIGDTQISSSVKSFLSKGGNKRFFDDLNEFVHNHAALPSFKELKHIYDNFHPYLLKIIE